MKKILFFCSSLFLILLVYSCDKDDEVPVPGPSHFAMTFTPVSADGEMTIGQAYTNEDGYPITLTDLRFYLSDIRLISHSGPEVLLSEISFYSMSDHQSSSTFEVPPGRYDSIAFNLGVPAEMNSPSNPDFLISAYSPNHPLSESNGMYWIWESGYRFFSIEGRCDTVANNDEVLPLSYSFHSGRDTLYRKIPAFYHPFTVEEGKSVWVGIQINLATFFNNGDSQIDLKTERLYHGSLDQMALGIKVADNSAAAFEMAN